MVEGILTLARDYVCLREGLLFSGDCMWLRGCLLWQGIALLREGLLWQGTACGLGNAYFGKEMHVVGGMLTLIRDCMLSRECLLWQGTSCG